MWSSILNLCYAGLKMAAREKIIGVMSRRNACSYLGRHTSI